MSEAHDLFGEDRRGQWRGARPHYAAGDSPPEYCDKDGALAIKEKIEAYWRERGQVVEIYLHETGFSPAMRSARIDVRSNMLNGWPRLRALPSPEQDQ